MPMLRSFALVVLVVIAGPATAEAQCSYSVSPTTFSVDSPPTSRTVSIITGTLCSWTATSYAGWITVTSGATGSSIGSVTFAVAENTTTSPRTGTLLVAGRTITVTQAANSCSYTVSPTTFSVGPDATSRTISVIAGTLCSWSATPADAWITVTSGATGSGIGSVVIGIAANPTDAQRTGTVSVAGVAVSVVQGAGSGGGSAPSAPTGLRIID